MPRGRVSIIIPYKELALLELMGDKCRLPGGEVRPRESAMAAAVRELREKFGLEVTAFTDLVPLGRDMRSDKNNDHLFVLRLKDSLSPKSYAGSNSGKRVTLVPGDGDKEGYEGPWFRMIRLHKPSSGDRYINGLRVAYHEP